jgi:signal transduction histidine kinase
VQKRTGLAYTLTLPSTEVSLHPGQATAVFRIVQEAVTNVLRHAEANTVAVHVVEHPDGLLVTIRDNGRGITPAQLADGASLGLLNMRERAQLCGGHVTIVGLPGVGTTVTVLIPFVPVVSKGTPDDPHSGC